ncbi:hypothetical protein VTO73DRAFT_6730 [Trametes versicolor]
MPELHSHSWAEPYLCKAINTIRESMGLQSIQWDLFPFVVRSPSEGDRQRDSWSCGLFVMIAMQNLADGWPEPLLGESAKEDVRAGALHALSAAPLRPPILRSARNTPAKPELDQPMSADSISEELTSGAGTGKESSLSASLGTDKQAGAEKEATICTMIELAGAAGKKRPHTLIGSSSDAEGDDQTPAAKKPKQRRKTPAKRCEILEADQWTGTVEAHRVTCSGCSNWIALRSDRDYDLKNWDKHRGTCSRITGLAKHRMPIKQAVQVQNTTNPNAIYGYFHSRGVLHTKPAKATTKYHTVVATVTPPITDHFRILPPGSEVATEDVLRPLPVPTTLNMPEDGNKIIEEKGWTQSEQGKLDEMLKAYARWEVDYPHRFVKARTCSGVTSNPSGVCNSCEDLAENDKAFKKAIYRKEKEAALPEAEQREKHVAREKYAPHALRALEARELQARMADPHVFRVWKLLENDKSTESFIELYEQARDGKLANKQTFISICKVMAEQIRRYTDPNTKLKHGMRYAQDYMNFMVVMRSYGQKSAQQYSILNGAIGGPCARSLRYFVKRSPDCLSDPDLVFENVARVKRLLDAVKYTGPVALAGDCTKVRKRLTFSNDYGSHILGAVLPLEECAVKDTNDIENIVTKVSENNTFATQVRAILVKVPLPQIPPLVVALLPTKGNDDASGIHRDHMRFLAMAKQLGMPVISMAADSAASELCAQALMDREKSEEPPLAYDFPLYGIHLHAPVFTTTGPLISVQDPPHARKTCRNQPQHGTHTASMGKGYVVNRSFIQLYETGISGLQLRDVQDVDKQDGGAARRMFHHMALSATTSERLDESRDIRPEFTGLFVYLFIFGELFDAWLNRRLSAQDRVLAALRARFFLYIWQCHIPSTSSTVCATP